MAAVKLIGFFCRTWCLYLQSVRCPLLYVRTSQPLVLEALSRAVTAFAFVA